jgi:hypothetical protein
MVFLHPSRLVPELYCGHGMRSHQRWIGRVDGTLCYTVSGNISPLVMCTDTQHMGDFKWVCVCETGIVFCNSIVCMCIVTLLSCPHTYCTNLWCAHSTLYIIHDCFLSHSSVFFIQNFCVKYNLCDILHHEITECINKDYRVQSMSYMLCTLIK